MKSRAQVSTEYLIIIAISMAILLPGGYFFYRYSVSASESSVRSEVTEMGNSIIASAESIYGLADGSLVTLDLRYPKNIRDIYVLGKRELVIRYELSSGMNEAVFFSKVDLVGNYSYPDRDPCFILPAGGCNDSSLNYVNPMQGRHQLKFESKPSGVFVMQTDEKAGPVVTIFVTSVAYRGDSIGDLSGADAKCQALASSAGFRGTWKAWLSNCQDTSLNCTTGINASSRLTHRKGPYILPNGVVVATNWADLTDGTINATINIDEHKNNVGVSLVATGTKADGSNFHVSTGMMQEDDGRYCTNWGSNGWCYTGNTSQIDYRWSSRSGSCSSPGCGGGYCNVANLRLYCLKQ